MIQNSIKSKLVCLYGEELAVPTLQRLTALIEKYRDTMSNPDKNALTEKNSILITYGDQVQKQGQLHFETLTEFADKHLNGVVDGIHILPFFPWTSDDGFSVIDYRKVDSELGDWSDVEKLGKNFRLMFDGVINHISSKSEWFMAYLRGEKPYTRFFISVSGNPDLSDVVRPRALPLLTEFQTLCGPRKVWTTFSADQVDLDFHCPDVLLEIIDILLMYAEKGAQFIRLDAIAYLWKEIGTKCIHLPQTHTFIQLLRQVFDETAPKVQIITETNVPHADNIAYFGDGENEAQLVYNFALPPLVLHTFHTGDATVLSDWAASLELPSNHTTFFNFLASHDGIGLNPAKGLLSPAEIDNLVKATIQHGGLISYKQNPDGSQSPYEMNISYFDALSNPVGNEPVELQVKRFMAAQSIMLCLRGVPGIYFHSLFGSRNWYEGVKQTKQNRTINRQKLDFQQLVSDLINPLSLRFQVFGNYSHLLRERAMSSAFHPNGGQKIIEMGKCVFAVLRSSPDDLEKVLCLQNVTAQSQLAGSLTLEPYQTLWVNDP